MSRANCARVILALALLASVIFAPWWLSLGLALALCVRFRAWEVVAAGVFYDLLWLPGDISSAPFMLPLATLIALALVFGFEPLRRQLLI